MRDRPARALLLALALLLGGCVGASKDIAPDATTPPTTTAPGGPSAPLAPLHLSITGQTPTGTPWVAPGAPITVKATPPSDATGDVRYVWAVGAYPGTAPVTVKATPDTGAKDPSMYLQPGESRGVRFSVPGSWQMHCHPHPWMRSNVTVVDNYTGPAEVTVDIVDGTTSSEFHFVPENIVVAPGTVVVYHNAGNLPHSATSLFQDAPVKLLPLKDASGGTVTIDPNPRGWQRIRLFAWDATGRMGVANYDVYVSDLPVFQPKSVPISFHAGGLPSQAVQPSLSTILTTYNGTMFVNFTVKDAGGPAESAAGQNLAQVTVHVRSDTDIMTKEKASSGQMSARALAGLYTIEIDPVQGAEIDGTLTVEEAYDLTPPPPAPYVDPESIPHKH